MQCPICNKDVEEYKAFCPCCSWEFKPDLHELPTEQKAVYDERVRIARENWRALHLYRELDREVPKRLPKEPAPATAKPEKIRRKILFCTDLHASSDYAFASALDLAERSGAELIILHVLGSPHRYSGLITTAEGETWASDEVFDKTKERLKEYYFCRIEEENPRWIRVAVRGGTPWIEILRFARKEKVDRIVIGPYTIHDPRLGLDLERPRLGENAEKIILQSPCPVCVVTSPKQRLSFEN